MRPFDNTKSLPFEFPALSIQGKQESFAVLAGALAFGSTLAVSTWSQLRVLGISTGTPAPIPSVTGFISVCLASLVSHQAALITLDAARTGRVPSLSMWKLQQENGVFGYRQDYLDLQFTRIPLHSLRICALGLVTFRVLGGRFWAIAPSSYTHLGSFARPRFSIPATETYATSAKRAALHQLGKTYGCHTCGSKGRMWSLRWKSLAAFPSQTSTTTTTNMFIGDHMPPKAVAQQMNGRWYRRIIGKKVNFRFFPQCVDCSSKQGAILSQATALLRKRSDTVFRRSTPNLHQAGGGAQAYFHGFRPRINHLAGGILGAVAVVGVADEDLMDENRWRYAKIHRDVDLWIRRQWADLKGTFRKWNDRI